MAKAKKAADKKPGTEKPAGKKSKKVDNLQPPAVDPSATKDAAPVKKSSPTKPVRNTPEQSAGENGLPSSFVRYWEVD
jgi:hypothetical protein